MNPSFTQPVSWRDTMRGSIRPLKRLLYRMKSSLLLLILAMTGSFAHSQTSLTLTSTEVSNILKGSYTPAAYAASSAFNDPNAISIELVGRISTDSLKSSLVALRAFQNRNTGSDTVSNTRGIGAARRWVYNKFLQYSAANGGRLRVSYFQFSQSICSKTRHRNVLAVLPGSQTSDKSVILIEAHLDSRCENVCDISCNAFGADDDASGTALVMELARILSRYTFRNTLVFSINIGEEQGLYGATAFASWLSSNSVKIKAVNNNDVSGGIFCGHTSSAPSCPAFGNIDSIGLRIFSYGGFNSPHKQWARYIKLEYQEQLRSLVNVVTDIRIMTPEDRTGRGGDHQPFRADGYTAVRFTEANEDGNANSTAAGYVDRQHSVRDSLGVDRNNDGVEDTMYVNLNYLARNTLINGNSMAMAALGPDTAVLSAAVIGSNKVKVSLSSTTAQPGYRIAIRSATNDWDSVYTVTAAMDTLTLPYGSNTNFFISAASMDVNNIESLFGKEYSLTTGVVSSAASTMQVTTASQIETDPYKGVQLLQNKPNPFDEATMITVVSSTDEYDGRAWINITSLDGRVLQHIRLSLKKGVNEVLYSHGYGVKGTYICTLLIDGLPVQSRKMIFQ